MSTRAKQRPLCCSSRDLPAGAIVKQIGAVVARLFFFSVGVSSGLRAEAVYDFELVADGAVIASDGSDTAYPSVIRVPSWIAPENRADADANYYMYYGNHTGSFIRMKWAESLQGPWTAFDLEGVYNSQSRRGVFDVDADSTRDTYDHIAAPDVHVDHENQRIVMYYHGRNQPSGGTGASRLHESFVTTSGSGLNFNDPLHGGGEIGHGPRTVTVEGVTRDIWIGEDYQRAFEKDGNWYSVAKRAILNKAPDPFDIWAPNQADGFDEAWLRESTPSSLWHDDANPAGQSDYYSPAATFLASSEFANHPNNPLSGENVFSNGNDERLNHVSVNLLADETLEIFFYVREASGSAPDRYDDIYRIVLDVSDPDFENWEVARDANGQGIFDVALRTEDLYAAVQSVHGAGFDPDLYADPVSLGDTGVFIDEDGSKYLFLSYVSDSNGGSLGEGQITAVKLLASQAGDFNLDGLVDSRDFDLWRSTYGSDNRQADGNQDSVVNAADYTIWRDAVDHTVITSVPEPGTLLLLAIASAVSRTVQLTSSSARLKAPLPSGSSQPLRT